MKAIESKNYVGQYNGGNYKGGSYKGGQQYGGGNHSGGGVSGFFSGILAVAVIVALVLGVANMMGIGKENNSAGSGTGVRPGVYVENSVNNNTQNKEEEEVKVPISTQYSCQGNYYSVFTQKQNVTDNCGTTYESANVAVVGSLGSAKKLTYKLDGSFTKLKGTIALAEQDKDRINYFRVYVYNDKGDCIYQSADISDKSPDPIQVNCSISGLEQITIEMEGVSTTCTTVNVIMPEEGFVFSGPSAVVAANS